jgi:integrase
LHRCDLRRSERHTGNSLMYDAEIRPDLVMRRVGHASQEMSQRYNHPEWQAHLAASARVTALVSGAGNGS